MAFNPLTVNDELSRHGGGYLGASLPMLLCVTDLY